MARYHEDELVGDDLEAILQAMDEDFFDFDLALAGETDDISTGEENAAAKKQFACSLCPKVCISQRGFTRHMNAKHKNQQTQSSSAEKQLSAEEKLSPSTLKELLESVSYTHLTLPTTPYV